MSLHESEVAQVWADVLGVQNVDVRAGFFDLGGNSLLLLELIGALETRFGVHTDVLTLLERSSVAEFTRHWNATSASASASAQGRR